MITPQPKVTNPVQRLKVELSGKFRNPTLHVPVFTHGVGGGGRRGRRGRGGRVTVKTPRYSQCSVWKKKKKMQWCTASVRCGNAVVVNGRCRLCSETPAFAQAPHSGPQVPSRLCRVSRARFGIQSRQNNRLPTPTITSFSRPLLAFIGSHGSTPSLTGPYHRSRAQIGARSYENDLQCTRHHPSLGSARPIPAPPSSSRSSRAPTGSRLCGSDRPFTLTNAHHLFSSRGPSGTSRPLLAPPSPTRALSPVPPRPRPLYPPPPTPPLLPPTNPHASTHHMVTTPLVLRGPVTLFLDTTCHTTVPPSTNTTRYHRRRFNTCAAVRERANLRHGKNVKR